jgi:TonB family protein
MRGKMQAAVPPLSLRRVPLIKSSGWIRRLLAASVVLSFLPYPASAIRPSTIGSASALHLQESAAGAPLGKLNVSAETMARQCITMVSPGYPQSMMGNAQPYTVIVRVVVWKSGNVSPMRVISGPLSLQDDAMKAVRLWRYRPYTRDGEPLDVTTDVKVNFVPGKSGGVVSHPNN